MDNMGYQIERRKHKVKKEKSDFVVEVLFFFHLKEASGALMDDPTKARLQYGMRCHFY